MNFHEDWISVDDRLPDNPQSVLVWDEGFNIALFDVNEGGVMSWYFLENGYIDPTHWMSLPDEPRD